MTTAEREPVDAARAGESPIAGDGAIIEASRSHPERFVEVFDRYAAAVHRYATRRVGPGPADDVTTRTFLAAFRRRHRFDIGQTDTRPWLYGIATNSLRRHRRTERRQYRVLARTGVDLAIDHGAEMIVARVAAGAHTQRLAEVLAGLPARERDVLLLIAWERFGHAEVARALDIPVETVRSRLRDARTRLRAAVAQTPGQARSEDELTPLREMRADLPPATPAALRAARSELLGEAGRRRRLRGAPRR